VLRYRNQRFCDRCRPIELSKRIKSQRSVRGSRRATVDIDDLEQLAQSLAPRLLNIRTATAAILRITDGIDDPEGLQSAAEQGARAWAAIDQELLSSALARWLDPTLTHTRNDRGPQSATQVVPPNRPR
jgi:hypothetical protein